MLLSGLKDNYIFKKKRIVLPVGILLILALALMIWAGMLLTQKTIHRGIFIENLNVSNLTVEQAKEALKKHIEALYGSVRISVIYGDKYWEIDKNNIGFGFSTDDAVAEAYAFGRTGGILHRLGNIIDIGIKEVNIPAKPVFNGEALYSVFNNIKKQIDLDAKSASVKYKNGEIVKEKDAAGKILDIENSIHLFRNELAIRNFNNINLVVKDVMPPVVYDNISDIDGVLGYSTTSFNQGDLNRTSNIKLACERINGIILMPGEVFSMNKALGPRTIENGYKDAKVIYKNEFIDGPGGGVCQVTTTLYGAVLKSMTQVVERTPHSLPLGYVEPGQDATIAEDYIDFKFKNSFDYPISINADVYGGNLYTRILGKKNSEIATVKLKSVVVEEYEPDGEEIVIDESLTDNDRHVISEPKKGLRVLVYRETFGKDGKMIQREKISDNDYKAVRAKVKVSQNYFNVYNEFMDQ